jgi:hypothetical protein
MKTGSTLLFAGILVAAATTQADAWTRAGHMVTAAIAYDDLVAHDPAVVAKVTDLLLHHPDRGAFQVAIARTTDDARARRLFYECARWPDDVRGGPYDHPTWHYVLKPVVRPDDPPPHAPSRTSDGDAAQAFALNFAELRDPNAPDADRALALCWVMHITGDVHQPLHTAQLFSPAYPAGDHGGSLEMVTDPETHAPEALHWFWDDSVNRSDEPADVEAKARALEARFPRATLSELSTRDVVDWAEKESYPLAVSNAYGPRILPGAPATLSPDYVAATKKITERRVALAGYRLADLLRDALGTP